MLDPVVVERAFIFPNQAIDGPSEGQMVDLGTTIDPQGQLRGYLSVKYARKIGRACGLIDPDVYQDALDAIAERDEQIVLLEERVQQLQGMQANVISLDDARNLIVAEMAEEHARKLTDDAFAAASPRKPGPKPKQAA